MVQIFQVSPAVNVREIDLSTIVPSVATTDGALAGVFRWGPVGKIILTDSESNLAARLGPPKNLNAETFFMETDCMLFVQLILLVLHQY